MQNVIMLLGQIPPVLVYIVVLVWLAAESCGVPLPNELVLLFAGSLAAQAGHGLSPVLLVAVATLGSLGGASAAYLIGRRGGRAAVLGFGKRFGLDARRLDSIEASFRRSGPVAIFLTRITPFVRTVASFPAGMLQLPRATFLLASALGSLLWCAVLVTLGVALGANYLVALHLIERYTLPAALVFVALAAGYIWLHRRLERVGTTDAADAGGAGTPGRTLGRRVVSGGDRRASGGRAKARRGGRPRR